MGPTDADTVIFLGPSLDAAEAARHLRAQWWPPVRRGDLPAVVAHGVRRIGIIDGEFDQSLAVSVSEVRAALARGAQVWGAASMGALRAAECHGLGMCGIGWVYRGYAEGWLAADDEVALLFDPHSGQAATVPLVNFRWALLQAVSGGAVSTDRAAVLLSAAQAVRYWERDGSALIAAARDRGCGADMEALLEFVARAPDRCDRKRLDALELLNAMADDAASRPS